MTAALAVLLAAGLVIGGLTADPVLVLAVALVQGAFAVRWFAALQVLGARAGVGLVIAAGIAADFTVLVGDDARPMGWVPAVLGVGLLGALAIQLFRRDGRADLTASLVATGSALVIVAAAVGWLGLETVDDGLVLVASVAAASVPVLDAAGRAGEASRWLAYLTAFLLAGVAALAVAAASDLGVWPALGCAAAAAVAARVSAVLAARVAAPVPPLSASLPLVLAAPAAYVVARVLGG